MKFRALSRGVRSGVLLGIPIQFENGIEAPKHSQRLGLVVSIPSACGNAVKRNRFRRIVKSYLKSKEELTAEKGLWIRVSPRHKLGRLVSIEDYRESLEALLSKLF